MQDKKTHNGSIIINANRKISVIKQEFNAKFPFLKLEFFQVKHQAFAGSSKKDMITQDYTLKQLSANKKASEILVSPDMQVSKLEELFQKEYKISVQVFRKSGRSWLETSFTDDWTLQYQNEQGRELSHFA